MLHLIMTLVFELELKWGAHSRDRRPPRPGFEPRFSISYDLARSIWWVSLNAPPQNESSFGFTLGGHTHNGNPPWTGVKPSLHGCKPMYFITTVPHIHWSVIIATITVAKICDSIQNLNRQSNQAAATPQWIWWYLLRKNNRVYIVRLSKWE